MFPVGTLRSIPAPGENPDDPAASRVSIYTDGELYDNIRHQKTLAQLFDDGLKNNKDRKFLGTSDGMNYNWISYSSADEIRKDIGSALVYLGLKRGDMVGISSPNSAEWTLLGLGCDTQSMILVPLYDTLGKEGMKFILHQTELSVIFCHPQTLMSYLNYIKESPINYIRVIVKLKGSVQEDQFVTEVERELAKKQKIELIPWSEFLQRGGRNTVEPNYPNPDDVCTICYTSGTTGFPKGAMITHSNFVSTVDALIHQLSDAKMIKSDCILSYLPAAHIFERVSQACIMSVGGSIGFWRGSRAELLNDIQILKPTILPCVPRVMNVLYDQIMLKVGFSGLKSTIFNWALNKKSKRIGKGLISNSSFWDFFIFKKIQKTLGGNIRLMAVGGAAIKPHIIQFFRAVLGAHVFEAYGQTECTGACAASMFGDFELGYVGGVINHCQVRLVDVLEMNYLSENKQGEICIKGLGNFKGYFKEEELTRKVIDNDGWLHTGDIGEWTEHFALKIIDRKSHIFKLSQGEFISPEKIEMVLNKCPLISQSFVYGHPLKSQLVAIIVPNQDLVNSWAKKSRMYGSFLELCKMTSLKEEIFKLITELNSAADLKGFEKVKRIFITPDIFGIENDLVTPTMKLKRDKITKLYQKQIEDMYRNI